MPAAHSKCGPAVLWRVPSVSSIERGPKQFVDFQNDTSSSDIALAVREGYRSVEHVKRYTALGFGTDQGKLGNINGMAILAGILGSTIAETGTHDELIADGGLYAEIAERQRIEAEIEAL